VTWLPLESPDEALGFCAGWREPAAGNESTVAIIQASPTSPPQAKPPMSLQCSIYHQTRAYSRPFLLPHLACKIKPPATAAYWSILHLSPSSFHPVTALIGKQQRLVIPADLRAELAWPADMPKSLLVEVLGPGVLSVLGPETTRAKEDEWKALQGSEDARQLLFADQRRHHSVRFEKAGFRIYLVHELLFVLQLPIRTDPAKRIMIQATPDGDVLMMTHAGYLAWLNRE